MREFELSPPKFGFIVATRAALALGAGLLLSSRIPDSRRRAIGGALVAFGVAMTIPALMTLLRSRSRPLRTFSEADPSRSLSRTADPSPRRFARSGRRATLGMTASADPSPRRFARSGRRATL